MSLPIRLARKFKLRLRGVGELKIEITKFTLVGAANFLLTFIVFTVMLKVMRLDYLISLGGAWIAGVLFSYVLNFSWVFRPGHKVQLDGRFIKFLLAGSLSVGLNMIVLRYLVERTNFDPFHIQIALMPLIVIFNFITAKYWSLR